MNKGKEKRERKRGGGGWYYRLELSKKRVIWGVVFLLPWLLGFLMFFLRPLIETISYSFSTVTIGDDGIQKTFIALANYKRAFTVEPLFNRFILTMASQTLPQVAVVIIFSLLAAILINGKYPGRGIVRTIFFIPIIMGTNIAVSNLVGSDPISQETTRAAGFGGFSTYMLYDVLENFRLPSGLMQVVSGAISGIFQVLATSGVPVLIFLAGLQSISPSLYEVAKIEGSSAYEAFWKVTLPMISPMVLLCTVYTIIDAFSKHSITTDTGTTRVFLTELKTVAFQNGNYGLASAEAVVYMLVAVIIIALVSVIISRVVFYYD